MPKAASSTPRTLLLQSRTNPSATASSKCTINALPCQVNHTGPVDASPHYWNPTADPNDHRSSTSYFRGRRLRGRKIVIPEGYEGVVLKKTGRSVVQQIPRGSDEVGLENEEALRDEEDDEDEEKEEMQVVEQVAGFDHVVVWNHEVAPDPLEDPYSKGIEEWIGFADAIHGFDET